MTQRQDDIKATPLWPHQFPGGLPRQPPVSPADARSCQAISQLVGKSDHVTHLRETRQGTALLSDQPGLLHAEDRHHDLASACFSRLHSHPISYPKPRVLPTPASLLFSFISARTAPGTVPHAPHLANPYSSSEDPPAPRSHL